MSCVCEPNQAPFRVEQNKNVMQMRIFVVNDPYPLRVSGPVAQEIGLGPSIVFLQLEYLISVTRHLRKESRNPLNTLRGTETVLCGTVPSGTVQ